MDDTAINARNWGAPTFCLFLCCKMGCLWRVPHQGLWQKKALLAKMKREGEPSDSARICEVNYTVHSSETEKH